MKWGEFMYDSSYLNNYPYQTYNKMDFLNAQGINNNICKCVKSFFRILNGIPETKALDVYTNETLIASNLKFGDFSTYIQIMPGNYTIWACESGDKEETIFETNITVDRNLAYTGILSGDMSDIINLNIYMIPEHKEIYNMNNMAAVKIINSSQFSPPLELVSDDGTTVFSGVQYGQTTKNVALPAGQYMLSLREKERERDKNIISIPIIDFAPGMYYALFVIGEYKETPRMLMLVPEDGLNYLDLC